MEIPGVNKKRCGISRGDKKDCGISMESWSLVFGLGNSNANGWMQFCGISRREIVSGISKGLVNNLKNPRDFSQKRMSSTPLLGF